MSIVGPSLAVWVPALLWAFFSKQTIGFFTNLKIGPGLSPKKYKTRIMKQKKKKPTLEFKGPFRGIEETIKEEEGKGKYVNTYAPPEALEKDYLRKRVPWVGTKKKAPVDEEAGPWGGSEMGVNGK